MSQDTFNSTLDEDSDNKIVMNLIKSKKYEVFFKIVRKHKPKIIKNHDVLVKVFMKSDRYLK